MFSSSITDVSCELPSVIKSLDGKLTMSITGNRAKYVLEVPAKKYRGFIYVNNTYKDSFSTVRDLYNNFYYTMGLSHIAERVG